MTRLPHHALSAAARRFYPGHCARHFVPICFQCGNALRTVMAKYIIKRVLVIIPMLLVLTFATYGLMEIAPGDPAEMKLKAQGVIPSEEALEKTRAQMHLDEPFIQRYGEWLVSALHGDLGTSYKDNRAVTEKLGIATGYTAILALSALIISLIISFPLGIAAALRRNGFFDYLIRFMTFIGNALPRFLLAVLLIYFFCLRMKVFPVIAKETVNGLFLPALCLAIGLICEFTRQIRAEVLEQIGKPYVTGAKARGVKAGRILCSDILHNAMITLLTVIGLSFAGLLGGSVVIETIFQWPGLGKLCMDAITNRDYPVVLGFVIWICLIYMIVNLITDISYRYFDPRVKEE